MTSDLFESWPRGVGIVALAALLWATVIPDGIFWSAVLAVSVIGAAIATSLLVRSRQVPTLAQMITNATAGPVLVPSPSGYTSAPRLRPIGGRKP
jgi:hypothetical protein